MFKKWVLLPYVVLGICLAIGLLIGMAPDLLGDVIPRHGVIGRMLASANQRKIEDSQHTVMVVPDYVRRVVTLGAGTVDLVSVAGEPYVVATDGSPYSSSAVINGRVQPTVESIQSYEPDVVVAPDTTPPGLVASLRAAGIPVFIYTMKDSLKDISLNTKQVAKLFNSTSAESSINSSVMNVKKQVEPHKNDVKPVIVLYNPTHGLYRSGVLRDMIEMIHGIDGAGNLKIIERGKDPNVLSDVWDYRASSPTFNMQENMGTKADLIRINPDIIFVPTRYIDKLPDYKEDFNAVIKDPELQNVTAIKKGYVYPIHEMHIMSYSSWMYFGMQQMSKWLYGDWSYDNFVKYQSVPAN